MNRKFSDKFIKIWIKLVIILLILIIAFSFINKKQSSFVKEDNLPSFTATRDASEKDELYYYNLIGDLVLYMYNGIPKDEAIALVIETGYSKDEAENIIKEVGIDWENKRIINKNSKYYNDMEEAGLIFEEEAE